MIRYRRVANFTVNREIDLALGQNFGDVCREENSSLLFVRFLFRRFAFAPRRSTRQRKRERERQKERERHFNPVWSGRDRNKCTSSVREDFRTVARAECGTRSPGNRKYILRAGSEDICRFRCPFAPPTGITSPPRLGSILSSGSSLVP